MVDLEAAGRELRDRDLGPVTPVEELARRVAVRRRRRRARTAFAVLLVAVGLVTVAVRGDRSPAPTDLATDGGDTPRTTTTVPPVVPDLIGIDYAEAQARAAAAGIAAPGTRVLLALDLDVGQPLGVVTRTDPAPGDPIENGVLVIYAAATRPEIAENNGVDDNTALVFSHIHHPPEGLLAGMFGPGPDECAVFGEGLRDIRFIRGELVGCWGAEFIWLDKLQRQAEANGNGEHSATTVGAGTDARCGGHLAAAAGWPADAGAPNEAPLGAQWAPPLLESQKVLSWPGLLDSGVELRWPVTPAPGDGDYEDVYEVAGMLVVQANVAFGSAHHSAIVRLDPNDPSDCRSVSVHAFGPDFETTRRDLRTFVENLTITVD